MPSKSEKLRILIADDHQLVRDGIRTVLKANRNFRVVAQAVDGNDAIEKAKAVRPDLAILDITMPVLDGLDATQKILQVSPNTKILVLTMHESDQMVRRVLGAGAAGYVLKSDLAQQLVKAVKCVAQGGTFLSPAVSTIVLNSFLQVKREGALPETKKYTPSSRETEVIRLLAHGKTNKEVSSILGIAVKTVESHRAKIMLKLGIHSLVDLVHYANTHGITGDKEGGFV